MEILGIKDNLLRDISLTRKHAALGEVTRPQELAGIRHHWRRLSLHMSPANCQPR